MKKVMLSYSSGLDSTTLLWKLIKEYGKENVIAVTFDFGQKNNITNDKDTITFTNNIIEKELAKKNCEEWGIKQIIIPLHYLNDSLLLHFNRFDQNEDPSKAGKEGKTAFAYRNLILIANMLSLAVLHNCEEIYLGFQNEDSAGYPDTTPEFVNNLQKLIKDIGIWPVKIKTPFINLTKADEIKLGLKLGVDYSKTHTCYSPKIINGKIYSCGHCPACLNRLKNFKIIGEKDPISYIIDNRKE